MPYIDKYSISKKWAQSAYNEKEYDVATNRYYYSIFQKILYELESKGIKVIPQDNEGTHNSTARAYVENIIEKKPNKEAFPQKTKFTTCFQDLKRFRHTADYYSDSITLEAAKMALNAFQELDKIIAHKVL